jgi:hypothetical protein
MPLCSSQVSAFRPWIDCIIESTNKGMTKDKVEKFCQCIDEHTGKAKNKDSIKTICDCQADRVTML